VEKIVHEINFNATQVGEAGTTDYYVVDWLADFLGINR